MPFSDKVQTQSNSHHFALVVFPWQYEWPDSTMADNGIGNEYMPEVISTSGPEVSRIVHISHQKRKELVSGSLVMDFISQLPKTGVVKTEGKPDLKAQSRICALGNWVVWVTSSNGPVGSTYDEVQKAYREGRAIVQFIGQVSSVHSSYFADASGTLRQTNKISCRDWSFVFEAPSQFAPSYLGANLTIPAQLNISKEGAEAAATLDGKLTEYYFNAFTRPIVIMHFMGMYRKDFLLDLENQTADEEVEKGTVQKYEMVSDAKDKSKKVLKAKPKEKISILGQLSQIGGLTAQFVEQLGRLPLLPKNLISFLNGDKAVDSSEKKNALGDPGKRTEDWYNNFMGFMSGVQDWQNDDAPDWNEEGTLIVDETLVNKTTGWNALHKDGVGKWILTGEKSKRPYAPFNPTLLKIGESAKNQMEASIEDLGIGECYSDLIQVKDKGGRHRCVPCVVVRDIPYSMRTWKANKGELTYDSTKGGADRLIEDLPGASDSVVAGVMDSHGYPWTQYEALPYVSIPPKSIVTLDHVADLEGTTNYLRFNPTGYLFNATTQASLSVLLGTSISVNNQYRFGAIYRELGGRDTVGTPNVEAFDSFVHTLKWFESFRDKFSEFYSTSYRYGSGTLKIKDNNYRIVIGHNLQFQLREDGIVYRGHVKGVDRRYTTGEGGTVVCVLMVHLTRIVVIADAGKSDAAIAFPHFYLKGEMYNKKNVIEDLTNKGNYDFAASRPAHSSPISKSAGGQGLNVPQQKQTVDIVKKATEEKTIATKKAVETLKAVACKTGQWTSLTKDLKEGIKFKEDDTLPSWSDLDDATRGDLATTEIGNLKDNAKGKAKEGKMAQYGLLKNAFWTFLNKMDGNTIGDKGIETMGTGLRTNDGEIVQIFREAKGGYDGSPESSWLLTMRLASFQKFFRYKNGVESDGERDEFKQFVESLVKANLRTSMSKKKVTADELRKGFVDGKVGLVTYSLIQLDCSNPVISGASD